MFTSERKWYQIYTKSNREKKLHEKITSMGGLSYLPIRTLSKKWTDRTKIIEQPAFKSYLFAKLYPEEARVIEQFSEFVFFIRYQIKNNQPPVFPHITDDTIETIKRVLAAYPEAELINSTLKKGDAVEIISGNLDGYKGTVTESDNSKKVCIELQGLNQSLLITVCRSALRLLTPTDLA